MVKTMRKKLKGYVKKEIEKAIEARHLQGITGNPSQWHFEGIIHAKIMEYYKITENDW